MNKQIILAQRPEGLPKESDFKLVESPIPTPTSGEILARSASLRAALRFQLANLVSAGGAETDAGRHQTDLHRGIRQFPAKSANPDPAKQVHFGEQTFDEMFIGYLNYADLPQTNAAPAVSAANDAATKRAAN